MQAPKAAFSARNNIETSFFCGKRQLHRLGGMCHHMDGSILRKLVLCGGVFYASILTIVGAAAKPQESTFVFDLPAEKAERALKKFSVQTGLEVIYVSDAVSRVTTAEVRGRYTPQVAMERLLFGTKLNATQDNRTGAFTITRNPDPERKPGAPRGGKIEGTGDAQDTIAPVVLDRFEVKGSKATGIINQGVIRRGENEALRFEVMNRKEIEDSGATNLSELFYRQIPSITSAGTGTQRTFAFAPSFSTGFGTTTDAVNFRGLGTNRSLTLVNGRRMYAGEAAGADVSRFPIGAIARIEILPSSASAIYGGNAVGGAVNVILRKDYQGSEGRVLVGSTTAGGASELQASYFQGLLANNGRTRISASVDYVHKASLLAGDRSFYDQAPRAIPPTHPGFLTEIAQNFVGARATVMSPNNTTLGIPGAESATYASVPVGSTGMGLLPSGFSATAAQAQVSDQRVRRGVLLPSSDTYSGFLVLEREITEGGLEAYAELGYRYSTYDAAYPGFLPTVTLSPTHSFNPFRTGATPGFVGRAVRILFDPMDLPDARTDSRQQAYRVVGGLKGKLSGDNWQWSADLSWDMTDSRAHTLDYLRFLAPAVNAGIYNPLRDLSLQPMQSAAEQEKYLSRRSSLSRPEVSTFNARANGDLFELSGGPLTVSFGAEGRFETDFSANTYSYGAYSTLPGASLTASSRNDTFRRVLSGYAEISIPLVGGRNRLPAIHQLEFSLAGRLESYDDFGGYFSPMLAVKMEPYKGITFRGSYGQGFLPPSQSSLFGSVTTTPPGTVTFVDPLRPGQARGPITQTSGGNPNLDPETTDALDVGVILQPSWASALTISATYYRYDTQDRIVSPSLQNIIDWESIFPQRVQRAAPTAADSAVGRPGLITGVDRTQVNVARLVTDGIDFRATYRIPTDNSGIFMLAANGTAGLSYKTQAITGAPFINTQGDIGDGRSTYPPLDLRGQLSLRWEKRGYAAGWTGRYTSGYQTNSTLPTASAPSKTGYDGKEIASTFEMDLQFSYRVPYQAATPSRWRRLFGGTQWTLGCLNMLDRAPPYITTYLGWYSLFSDPRGRFTYLQVKKNF